MKRWLVGCLVLVLGCLLLTACGSDSTSSTSGTSQSVSSSGSGAQSTSAQTVNIIEGEMYIKSNVSSFKVGVPYHFVIKNGGRTDHEFTIAKKVPGGDEDARDAASIKDVDNIHPGQSVTFDFTFKDPAPSVGMEFECSYPGHYEHGMHMDIKVQ